ncbi:MAG TPA: DUF1559 domain-containing protein [Gemmatales bacterium]|nr:DUF1559 domain-containing protein [Gemmatales bacterium]
MTLLESLIVIVVIMFLISQALPAIQRVRGAADRTSCQNNLRQIGQALHLYHGDHGRFPPAPPLVDRFMPERQLSWLALLLPYIDQKPLYDQSVQACAISGNPMQVPPHVGAITVIRLYVCPTDSRLLAARKDDWGTLAAFGSYLAASGGYSRVGKGYAGTLPGRSLAEVRDGPSYTVCVGERPPPDSGQGGWWYPNIAFDTRGHRGPNAELVLGTVMPYLPFDPQCSLTYRSTGPGRTTNPCDRFHFWSLHGGGGNFLFVDGSVRFLAYSVDPILPDLISIDGGEMVTLPD